MSFLISHPEGYAFVSPNEVPEDFVVKCYPASRIVDQTLPVEQWRSTIDHWEIDYDLPEKTIQGLFRYTKFKTFEEAAVKCNLLGLRCDKYDWLALPPSRAKNDGCVGTFVLFHTMEVCLFQSMALMKRKSRYTRKGLEKTMTTM